MSSVPVVTVLLRGGLGNQLFGWASGYALSRRISGKLLLDSHKIRRKDTEILDPRVLELGYFNLRMSGGENLCSLSLSAIWKLAGSVGISRNHSFTFKEGNFDYDSTIENITGSVLLDGYFQSWRYFESYSSEIIGQLTNRKMLHPRVEQLERTLRQDSWLGVHVRRGDYLNVGIMALPDQVYYRKAISLASDICGASKIMVFSDDIERAKELIPFADRFVGPEITPRPGDVVHLLSKATAIIGANSSLSWWAGYIHDRPEGPKIFPARWFSDPRRKTPDLIPPGWITVGI